MHPQGGQTSAAAGRPSRLPLLGWLVGLLLAGASGCGLWDEVTSREFHFKTMFVPAPDPLVVLRDDPDGDHRQKAIRRLDEPKEHGGRAEDQDVVLNILATAASTEKQALCRLAAIQKLATFKDPRAGEGLMKAYDNVGKAHYPEQTRNMLKCACLAGMGTSSNPVVVETLVRVLRQPRASRKDPAEDQQRQLDEMIAAARALGHFKQYQGTEALVEVLRSDRDVALRERAHESLKEATGKDLPPDAQVWADFLHQPPGRREPDSFGKKLIDLVTPASWQK